ncbi:MAG TPA: OsmC family protein [Streptosporangiaceae bacterium]|nr:OsmC family protein [Streptosporangiaceae bacterium]
MGGALEARGIPAGDGRLQADAIGEVELEGRTLVLKRISVRYQLQAGQGIDRPVIDRVMGFHADRCPVARSLRGAIDITTSIELVSA